ncbi:MAG: aminoacyl-histidine dipeptidase [Lachnospiraceae bacterium]|nr:aminoacyl-histidine dipeptidase [Lachnospiraceae bacterium]
MAVLSNIEPKKVFYYFEELTKIPHGSYNVDAISDFLADFGKNRGLETYQDDLKNVIMIKEATPGYENEPALILQGHMDMVAVHKPELDIDMKTEPLKVAVNEKEDYIYAEGTSLGGDDGIAVACGLALLDDDTLKHPRLEVVFTTNEETGMEGAAGIDLSMLKGNRLLNLDSEDEGIFLTSCAGGLRLNIHFPAKEISYKDAADFTLYDVEIGGLLGGHSGEEIIKGRANSNKLAGRLLYSYMKDHKIYISDINGGLADNAIPRVTNLTVAVSDGPAFEALVKSFENNVKKEFASKDPGLYVKACKKNNSVSGGNPTDVANNGSKESNESLKLYDAEGAIKFIFTCPNGVQAMSGDIEGLVETSLNLGIVKLELGENAPNIHATFSVRSSVGSSKEELTEKTVLLAKTYGGICVLSGNYPGWAFRSDSPLRDKMCALYEKMYGKKPVLKAIHAGLECGLLGNKIKDLDCVSIGPDMKDIHTTEEKLYISSSRRVYEFVRALIESK